MHHTDLATIAYKLKTTSLFTGLSDADRFIHKQLLFLAVAGLKPVSQICSGHWANTATGRRAVPDDLAEAEKFLGAFPIKYHIQPDASALNILVASNQTELKRMLKTDDVYETGLLFGFPQTAAHAMCNPARLLSLVEQDRMLYQGKQDAQLTNLACFRMSKQHYKTELETVKRWYNLLQTHGLLLST